MHIIHPSIVASRISYTAPNLIEESPTKKKKNSPWGLKKLFYHLRIKL